jgi:hypothetical protein
LCAHHDFKDLEAILGPIRTLSRACGLAADSLTADRRRVETKRGHPRARHGLAKVSAGVATVAAGVSRQKAQRYQRLRRIAPASAERNINDINGLAARAVKH